MRTRRWLTWLVFAVCALAVVEGLGWVTWQTFRLEARERDARAQSDFQEAIRLALWRMESEVTPIIAQEAARPYFQYRSFYNAEHAYNRMWQQVEDNEVRVPSPLLEAAGQYIHLHFQIEPDGTVTSPQVPTGNMRDLAEGQKYVEPEFIDLAEQMLAELEPMVRAPLADKLAPQRMLTEEVKPQLKESEEYGRQIGTGKGAPDQEQSTKEFEARKQIAQSANVPYEQRSGRAGGKPSSPPAQQPALASVPATTTAPPPAAPAPTYRSNPDEQVKADLFKSETEKKPIDRQQTLDADRASPPRVRTYQSPGTLPQSTVEQGPLEPTWHANPGTGAPELLVERTVRIESVPRTQGFWMDWPGLQRKLLASTRDLLPQADLVPLMGPHAKDTASAQRLATIPVLLAPGSAPTLPIAWLTPTHETLAVTWFAVLGAIVAIGLVLRASMELSDRRGRFVSAVTHELRTPLTTFCLYTEMLADGMVQDPAKTRDYLRTLKGESRRLAGIVENVLDYARLGGIARSNGHSSLPAPDLLRQALPALERRAADADMTLDIAIDPAGSGVITADPRTVERVLLNLVDNACKYAAASADRRIHLSLSPDGEHAVRITVRDHGPGVPRGEARRIFQPFHRARRDAEGPQSGLGLGLALARGLARSLGGDLWLSHSSPEGAEFALVFPAAYLPKT